MKFLKRLADASTWGLENQNSYLLRRHDFFSAKLEGGEKKKKWYKHKKSGDDGLWLS